MKLKRTGGLVLALVAALGLLAGLILASDPIQAQDSDTPLDSSVAGSLSPSQAAQPQGVISPTSSFLLYSRADDTTIWLKDEAGHAKLLDGIRPGLSPDGRYIVHQDEAIFGDLYVHDLLTGQATLVFTASTHLLVASWTPDGNRIVFDHGCHIYGMDRNGDNLETLIDTWPGSYYCYNDSPDSNPVDGRLAWENEYYGLGVAEADGSNPGWVPNTQPDDYSPRWSPDGQWIAFWRDDNAFKIQPDGANLTPLTFLPAGEWMEDSGQWTPDGKYLVAAAQVNGVEGLYAAAADGSGRLLLLVSREWEDPDWVGSAGNLSFRRVFLPLVARQSP
ncbi:MAG: PD40 domain-containing protein [Anaerolineae bacterium]|nr:PD40 domain-containing protein [Anaerolineae bacterium]